MFVIQKSLGDANMRATSFSNSNFGRAACVLVAAFFLASVAAWASKMERANPNVGDNEETFVFTGTCDNSEPYRLISYQKNIAGMSRSFYDYDGPNGKGTVQAETSPKVMAARVCRKFAEIINANYWE